MLCALTKERSRLYLVGGGYLSLCFVSSIVLGLHHQYMDARAAGGAWSRRRFRRVAALTHLRDLSTTSPAAAGVTQPPVGRRNESPPVIGCGAAAASVIGCSSAEWLFVGLSRKIG